MHRARLPTTFTQSGDTNAASVTIVPIFNSSITVRLASMVEVGGYDFIIQPAPSFL
jgi:hypothetical protein